MSAADHTSSPQVERALQRSFAQHYKGRIAEVAGPNTHFDTPGGKYTHEISDRSSQGLYATAEQNAEEGNESGLSEVEHLAMIHRSDPGGYPEAEWAAQPSQGLLHDPHELSKAEFRARFRTTHDIGLTTSMNPNRPRRFGESIEEHAATKVPRDQMGPMQEEFDDRVRSGIANSTVPSRDLRAWASKSTGAAVHGVPDLTADDGTKVSGLAGNSGQMWLDTGYGGPSTLIHEIGHEVHIPEMGGGRSTKAIPGSYSSHPHPVLEGVADAYMDQHTHPAHQTDRPYTTATQKPEPGGQRGWGERDLMTYLTIRQSAAQQGMPSYGGDIHTREELGRPMVDPKHGPTAETLAVRSDTSAEKLNQILTGGHGRPGLDANIDAGKSRHAEQGQLFDPGPAPAMKSGGAMGSLTAHAMQRQEAEHVSDPVEALAYHTRKSFS